MGYTKKIMFNGNQEALGTNRWQQIGMLGYMPGTNLVCKVCVAVLKAMNLVSYKI